MKKLLSLVLLASALSSGATEINGIAYKLNYDGSEATVIALDGKKYTGEITIPETVTIDGKEVTVTEIGEDAFLSCDGVTAVNLPSTISLISDFAFKDCSSLKKLEMPESLYMIGGYAFSGCTSMKSVTFNTEIRSISDYAFQDCTGLERVDISDIDAWFEISFSNSDANPVSKAHDLYLNGSKVTEIEIPDMVWEVSSYALAGSSVEKITVGEDVYEIGWYAFSECENLKEIVFNCSLDALDYGVFYGCKSLATITLPSEITRIGDYVFQGCTSLKSIKIPEAVTSLGFMAFAESGLESISISRNVTEIGSELFKDCTQLKSVTFSPETKITELPAYIFAGCSSLASFDIPAKTTRIDDSAFAGCSALTAIAIPSTMGIIEASAFSGCTGLKRVDITDLGAWCDILFDGGGANPLTLAGNLYLNNELVTDLKVPESVKSLSSYVFQGATCLKTVSLPTTLTAIPQYAFAGCTSLESVELPYSVSQVSGYAFEGDEALSAVKISDMPSWCNIDFENPEANPLFYAHSLVLNGTALEKLELPVSVSAVKSFSFAGGHFADIVFPTSLKTIGSGAFAANPALESLTFGSSLISIGNSAFANNTALRNVVLPASLSSILNDAFAGCDKISTILAKAERPAPIGSEGDTERHAFTDAVKENARLFVPSAGIDKYKEATEWMLFKNITGYDVENPAVVTLAFNAELGAVTDDHNRALDAEFIAEGNSMFTFWVKPKSGVTVESMSWNGDDVPMSPNGGTYIAMTNDGINSLVVNFTGESGIEAVEAEAQTVEVVEGGIIVAERAEVYTVEGRRVASTEGGFVALPAGIYMVSANVSALKVAVK